MSASAAASLPPVPAVQDPSVADVLRVLLEPLRLHYEAPGVLQMVVCDDAAAFVRHADLDDSGRWWRPVGVEALPRTYLRPALRALASASRHPFASGESPLLHVELPGGAVLCALEGSSMAPDARPGALSLMIRCPGASRCAPDPVRAALARSLRQAARRQRALADTARADLLDVLAAGSALLVYGSTASGKTTLLDQLLLEVDAALRVVTVEDARELRVPGANRLHLVVPRHPDVAPISGAFTPDVAASVVLRSLPDLVLLGEVSSNNAALAVQLLEAGLAPLWTTVHASTADEALGEIAFLASVGAPDRAEAQARILALARERLALARMGTVDGARQIVEVLPPGALAS